MSSNLNLNVSGNSSIPLPQETQSTDVSANAKVSVSTQPKDSVDRSEQPQGTINLTAYTANTSRPVLAKPNEANGKKEAVNVNRDMEGEHAAGTLAAGENTPTEQQTIEESLQAPEGQQKKQDNDQDGSQGGSGDSSGQGEPEFISFSTSELVSKLDQLSSEGKIQPMDSDQIQKLLNTFGKNVSAAGAAGAAAKAEGVEEPYPELKINGNTITGPNGSFTIPEPQTPPKSPSDVLVNSYHQFKGIADAAQAMLPQLPDGPEKFALANFLKTMLEALTKFQEFLYVMNNVDSTKIREKSKANLETTLHKLEEQRKKQEEEARKAREAGEKNKVMGVIGKVFGAVGISMSALMIVLAVALAFTGVGMAFSGLLLAVTITFLVVSIASMITTQATGKGIFERAFEGISKLVSALLSSMGIDGAANEWITMVLKIILVVLVCVIVIAANPIVFLFGGVSNVIGFITESGIINEFVGKCGGDEKAQMITTIVITSVIMMATMVISIAMMFIPGTQGALLGAVGKATETVTKAVTKAIATALQTVLRVSERVADSVTKVLMMILKFLINPGFWMTVTMVGLQTVDTVNKVKMNYLLADLAELQGEMTKMIEAADALIAIFKKIIQQLLEGLTETGTFISQTSEVIKKIVQGQSEAMTNLWSA